MARSKRKHTSGNATPTKAKKRKGSGADAIHDEDSIFVSMVTKAGAVLTASKASPNQLTVDQAVFQRDLGIALKRHPNYPQVAEEFVESVRQFIEDHENLRWCVMPTVTSADSENVARSGSQESIIRLLLGNDLLQPPLMTMLLEKLAEFTDDDDTIFAGGVQVNLPKLIMSQFRWLDTVVNSEELCSKMLEIVSVTEVDTQREIITCLPEVIDDGHHSQVAQQLKDLLLENQNLTVAILDALSNLSLKPELLAEVRGWVIQTLASVEMEDLPVVVKFLLQSVYSRDAVEVVSELRNGLDLHSSLPPNSASTPANARKSFNANDANSGRDSKMLTLDAIYSAIKFNRHIGDAWLKTIDGVKTTGGHKVIDLLTLLMLHSLANRKRPVESVVRNKIRSGLFTEVLLHAAFSSHAEVVRDYFPSVLSLAEVLLRSPEPSVSLFASAIYKHAFTTFDTYCQQEIVGNLVTHIGSGFAGEIDSSLDILGELVEKNTAKMAPFAIFVKGILDYLDNLSIPQIRKLYAMLATLAFRSKQDGAGIRDDMYILVRKQLSNSSPKYKRLGVIGAIMMLKSMACDVPTPVSQSQSSLETSLSDDVYQQVISLLQLTRTCGAKSPEAGALFMDELAQVIRSNALDPKVEAWLGENIISDFQEDYVVDINDEITEESVLPLESWMGLDDEAEGTISINLVPLLQQYRKQSKQQGAKATQNKSIAPVCLAPQFRLLCACEEQQQNGSLEGIDALLGCPVYMFKKEMIEKIESLSLVEKTLMCDALFYVINWFRELVNGFAEQKDAEMKGKIITRLQNITLMQDMLMKCLAATPGYNPPQAHFDCDEVTAPGMVAPSTGKRGRPAAKGGKKKKKDDDDKDGTQEDLDETSRDSTQNDTVVDKTQADSPKTSDTPTVDLSRFRGYFRELDITVFSMLSCGLITNKALESDMNTCATTTLQLQPPQLVFLLEDLNTKLEHSLLSSPAKRRCFLKTCSGKSVGFSHLSEYTALNLAEHGVKILPALASHLENTSAFFQVLIADNDGVLDGPGSNTEEAQTMGYCLQMLLQALTTLFSWYGFDIPENQDLLKGALSTLATRIKGDSGPSQISMQEYLKQAFHYLENFSSTVPNLVTAVTLARLLAALANSTHGKPLHAKMALLTEGFLKREWMSPDGQREKGAKHNENLQILIKLNLSFTEDPLKVVEAFATIGVPELMEADKNGCSPTYPTLNRNSYSVYYKNMLAELVSCIKAMAPSKTSDTTEEKLDKLLKWNLAVRIFHILVNLVKAFDGRSNLGAILKFGRQFLELFLRQGMPMLDHMFRAHREDVQGLLKNLQLSTRALHHMCGHSKIMKDISLTNAVPPMKKVLEMFVYRVKAMLTINRCIEAFWLGNLKNRDLQGEEILSQAAESQADDDTDNDADSLPEDEDSDVELDGESEGSKETNEEDESYSETY